MIVDLYLVYSFIRRLITPYKEWDAYKLGIIDENGVVLRKRNTLRTRPEKDAFGIFDVMILNIKKTIDKLPGGATKLATYAAALYLIREWNHFSADSMLNESVSDEELEEQMEYFVENYLNEEIANAVGGGNIAGLGVGPQGEPGFTKAVSNKYKKGNIELARRIINKHIKEEKAPVGAPKKMNDILAGEPKDKGYRGLVRKDVKHTRPTIKLT